MSVAKTTGNNAKIPGGVTGKGFKPGQSGNPKGRPRVARSVVQFGEELERKMKGVLSDGKTVAWEAWLQQLIASKNPADHRLIVEYMVGKVPDELKFKDETPNEPVKIIVEQVHVAGTLDEQ